MNAVVLLLSIFFVPAFQNHRTLKVSVYYESLCGDSRRFIINQLYPAYSKIGSYLSLDLVPYGKASHELINNEWKFICQHGYPECVGNKYQACGLALDKCQDKKLEFVSCLMGSANASSVDALDSCAPNLDVTSADILKCSESKQGDELLVKYGNQTHNVQPVITFVPTIIFDDEFNPFIQELALSNFFETACDALEYQPHSCQDKNVNVFN